MSAAAHPARPIGDGASYRRLRFWGLTGFFTLSLYPVEYAGVGDSAAVSVNYLFVTLPLLLMLARGTIRKPADVYLLWIGIYTAIFIVAVLYQVEYLRLFPRRLISFLLFMTAFSYMFVRLDGHMVGAFKTAVVLISAILSLDALVGYVSAGGAALGSSAKDVVGTQRVGFIYVIAVWLVLYERPAAWKAARYPLLAVLLMGCLLTFSRASVFALVGSLLLFATARAAGWLRRPRLRLRLRYVGGFAALALLLYVVERSMPAALAFFDETFLQLFSDPDRLTRQLGDPFYSEGFRVLLAQLTVEYATLHPLTGSGYLGIWILPAAQSGSTHNQLLDVLFRTGWLGLAGYLFLCWRLLRYLHGAQPALFWGLLGVLLYGLFHETFKESQGAFVLAFLLGMMSQGRRPPLSDLTLVRRG